MKNFFKTIKVSFNYLHKKCKLLLLLFFLRTIISAIIPLISIYFIKYITNYLYPTLNIKKAIFYIVLMLLLEFFLVILNKIVIFFIEKKNEIIIDNSKKELTKKMSTIFFELTENQQFADNYYKALDFVSRGSILHIINQFCLIVTNVITIIGLVYLIKEISLIALLLCFLIWIVKMYFDDFLNKLTFKMKDENYNYYRQNDYYIWNLTNATYIKEHKIYGLADFLSNKIDIASKNIISKMKQEQKILAKNSIIQIMLTNMLTAIIYISTIFVYYKRELEISQYSMLLAGFITFGNVVYSLINSCILIKNENYYFEKYNYIMNLYNVKKENTSKIHLKINTIEFKDVVYKYPNTNVNAINKISLKIDLKQYPKISLVGPTGSGKSTFIKLLLKLYKPSSGEILINGINIDDIDDEEYYKLYAPVFQDYNIFQCSIAENISFSNESITDELKLVELYDKVCKLDMKQNSNITKIFDQNGVDFSGGERQKIAIARALRKKSEIIVLDEPTAELSVESECKLYELLKKTNSNIFLISHRLASCKFTDKILVFDNGNIVENGNHSELMSNHKLYYKMFTIQAKEFKKVDDNIEKV